jgi:hypothetical protein
LNQRQGEVHSHLEPKNLHSTFDQDENVLTHLEPINLHGVAQIFVKIPSEGGGGPRLPSKNCVLFKNQPLAPNLRDSLITRANLARRVTFSQKWPLVNVGESGKSVLNGLVSVGESGESVLNGLASVGESGQSCKYTSTRQSAHDKVCRFIHKKHILYIFKGLAYYRHPLFV